MTNISENNNLVAIRNWLGFGELVDNLYEFVRSYLYISVYTSVAVMFKCEVRVGPFRHLVTFPHKIGFQ